MERLIGQHASRSDVGSLASIQGVPRLALAFMAALLAAGVVTNERSYLIAIPLIALCALRKRGIYTSFRRNLLFLTTFLILFGTIKGIGEGNNIPHVLRFTLPFTIFLFFAALPGLGLALARSRLYLLIVGLPATVFFFFSVKTGNWATADSFMPGWTMTYSSNAAVSVWMYFMLPVCAVAILGAFYRRWSTISSVQVAGGTLTLILLVLMNDTSAYTLAILAVAAIFLLPGKLTRNVCILAILVSWIIIIDFLTIKLFMRFVISSTDGNIDDIGDVLRLIQIEYFVDRSEFFGSGFGAQHDFPFMISVARQQAQLEFPYASELPILNIIYNGGIFAGMWFMMVSWSFFRLVNAEGARGDTEFTEIRLFGLSTIGVLIGSISNPYLFAPTSMMLLAVLVDLADTIGSPEVTPDSGP